MPVCEILSLYTVVTDTASKPVAEPFTLCKSTQLYPQGQKETGAHLKLRVG